MTNVSVPCRRCGKTALADSFVMSHELRQMVCPACAKQTSAQAAQKKEPQAKGEQYRKIGPATTTRVAQHKQETTKNDYKQTFATPFKEGSKLSGQKLQQNTVIPVKDKPRDWDDEDERLSRLAKQQERTAKNVPLGDSYRCGSCGYTFKRSASVKVYVKCPFCHKPI